MAKRSCEKTVAYVLKGYPRLSETFIASEIYRLEQQGVPLRLFVIKSADEQVYHPVVDHIQATSEYLPDAGSVSDLPFRRWLATYLPVFFPALRRVFAVRPVSVLRAMAFTLSQAVRARRSFWTWPRKVYAKEFLQAIALADGLLSAPDVHHLHAHFCHGATTVTWIAAMITGLSFSFTAHAKTFRIGPVVIDWNANTKWEGIPAGQLTAQHAVEVRGFLIEKSHMIATDVTVTTESDPKRIELIGAVTDEQPHPNGITRLTVAGVPADVSKSVSARSSGLVRRADERRPDEQYTIPLRGRPLTIGGSFSSKGRFEGNMELHDDADDDDFRFEQELKLEFFYPWNENMLFFLEGKATYEARFRTPSGRREVTKWLARDQAWLYWSNVADSRFSLQIGRQNFRDLREWWWDSDLDAVRVHYDLPRFHAELALAQEMMPVTTLQSGIDPIENKVFRMLGHTAWSWAPKHRVDGFFLYNLDYSKKHRVGSTVRPDREDESDANLVWLGLGASGARPVNRLGSFNYIVQGGWVGGTERLLKFDDNNDGKNSVISRRKRRISGWGFDSVLTWETELPWQPSFSVGYAFGSGDRNPGRKDSTFRQTDLQDNQGKFTGEKRFRYYGELLRPELSNLHIWTAAVGFNFWRSSSLDLVYHAYRQVHASSSVRSLRLDVDPRGKRQGIGQEWDVILAFRGWEHWDVIFTGSVFQAGSAFGKRSGNLASGLTLEVSYNF